MTYAAHADIEARYPGELAQAGPRDSNNDLDEAAIDLALGAADAAIDRALRTLGWPAPLTVDPLPDWIIALAVDLALYLATPTVLASQDDFADRKTRYQAALAVLDDIAQGKIRPPPLTEGEAGLNPLYTACKPRLFGRGAL